MANKSKDKEATTTVGPDISQLRNPIQISGKPIEQVLKGIHYGSPELRCLLLDECDLIFECKVCRALFRDVPNFISHKRVYCTKSSLEERHVAIAGLPEEKVVVIQPQAPEDTEPSQTVPTAQKPTRPTLDETIKRIQSGELGKSLEYQVYTEAAEKLQRQKEAMKIATIRTTPIPTNKNAVFIEVNTTSVNIHERQQQSSNNVTSLDSDSSLSDTHGTIRNKKPPSRMRVATTLSSQRHLRKPARHEKHTTEPQKLLLEQLKEIQHKVKQKSTQDNGDGVGRQKNATQENAGLQNKNGSGNRENFNDENVNGGECSEHRVDMKENAQQKESEDLRSLARQNFLSLLAKEEAKASSEKHEKRQEQEKGNVILRRRRNKRVWQNSSKQTATAAAKELVKSSSRNKKLKNSLTCTKCFTTFSSSSSLGFHMKIQHSSKRTFYQCPYCPSSFYYFYGITRHLFRNHSKTSDEINEMRSQLRDKAIIKALPPLKQKIDGLENKSSYRRSARGQVEDEASRKGKVNETVNTSQSKSIKVVAEVRYCAKTQLYRHNRKKTFNDFNKHETIVLNDSSNSEDSSSVISHKTDEKNEKEASTSKRTSFGSTKSSLLISTGSAESNKTCPTCKKTFSRPKNYEKHIKICQNSKSPSKMLTDKPVTPSKVQLTSPAIIEDVTDSKLSALKDKLLSSTFGLTGVTLQTEDLIDPKAVALKEKLIRTTFGLTRVIDTKKVEIKNKVGDGLSLNDNVTTEKTTVGKVNLTRKSNSSDREVSRASRELKSDAEKDKRDSSTESTQSSIGGRQSRTRRDVPSKYAVILTPAQKSPQRADIEKVEARTSLENVTPCEPMIIPLPKLQRRPDVDEKPTADSTSSRQNLVQMPKLQKKPELGSPSTDEVINRKDNAPSVIETKLQANTDSCHYMVMKVVNKNNLKSLLHQTNPVVRKSPLKSEPRRLQGRPQKTYFAPRMPSGSSTPPSGSQPVSTVNIAPARKSYASPQKYNMSTSTRRKPFLEYVATQNSTEDVPTLRMAQTPSAGVVQSENTKELELERDKRKNPEIDLQLIFPTKSVDDVSMSSISSLFENKGLAESKEKKPEIKEYIETQKKLQPMIQHVIKAGESDSENSKASDKFVSKGGKISPHLPVSALSERPKRKRKVPNKNLDAQDMLSKIHSRKPAVPRKKARMANVKSRKLGGDKQARRKQPSDDDSSSDGEEEIDDVNAQSIKMARGARKKATTSINRFKVEDDEEIEDDSVKVRGRVVSNRIYVLNESSSKVQKLKCYDQTRVGKYVNLEDTSCLQCGEVCTSISNLRRHVIRQHLKWSRFKCKLCRFESYDRSECTTHIFRTHKKIAAHNFSSRRSLNALIIDLVKEGLHARSLKKSKTLQGKQQSQNEGNIYTRPNVRKLPRLPERAAAAALLGARNSLSPMPVMDRDHANQSSKNKSPSSNSSTSPGDSWYKVSPSGKLRKVPPIRAAARNSEGIPNDDSQRNTITQGSKKESWFKVLPSGRLKKVLPFNISTRNSPRNFDTSPYKQTFLTKGNGEEPMLHTRKGKYTKANTSPAVSEFCKNLASGSTSNLVELEDSLATEDAGSRKKPSSSKDGNSKKIERQTKQGDSLERERSTSFSKAPFHQSVGEKAQYHFKRAQASSGDTTIATPHSQKPSVKYIITSTDGLQRFVEKSPKTMPVTNNPSHKAREITTEHSPALSDQLAKSLMKLKKLGDSMSTATKTTPTTSVANPGGSNTLVQSSSVPASTISTPITVVGKTETLPGKPQGSGVSVSIPLSLPSGSTPSSFVLTRGASGKIIVYTHSADEKQGTPTPANHPLKTLLPSPLTTSKITVKSKESGNKPGTGANTNSEEASLPSGTFVIQQHFL